MNDLCVTNKLKVAYNLRQNFRSFLVENTPVLEFREEHDKRQLSLLSRKKLLTTYGKFKAEIEVGGSISTGPVSSGTTKEEFKQEEWYSLYRHELLFCCS